MKNSAINTVYVIMHVFKGHLTSVNDMAAIGHGYLWDVYQREDDAKKVCERLNKDCSSLDKFVIIERLLM